MWGFLFKMKTRYKSKCIKSGFIPNSLLNTAVFKLDNDTEIVVLSENFYVPGKVYSFTVEEEVPTIQ